MSEQTKTEAKAAVAYHGSPRDRGSADAYYGRSANPHFMKDGRRVYAHEMTSEQLQAYHEGYENETDRKDWGDDD